MLPMNRVCVFCGSNPGSRPEYADAAKALGRAIADNDLGLVYGGARVGIMGMIADAVLKRGGEVIGVMPGFLVEKEVSHTGLSQLRRVDTMHERKELMAELSDAFIALPGGFGTIEEFFEVVTWAQLGIHRKPCGLLNTCGYFNRMVEFIDHAVVENFVRREHRSMILMDENPATLLNRFETWDPPVVQKWLDLSN